MVRVCFVDTSVLLELLEVPGKAQQPAEVRDRLAHLVKGGVQLVLPIATIIETGNHVAQIAEGSARRRCAERFVKLLRATAEGVLPWVLHSVAWDEGMLTKLCYGTAETGAFVDLAGAGILGTGDLAILAERELYQQRTSGVEVGVWTRDARLAAYVP